MLIFSICYDSNYCSYAIQRCIADICIIFRTSIGGLKVYPSLGLRHGNLLWFNLNLAQFVLMHYTFSYLSVCTAECALK